MLVITVLAASVSCTAKLEVHRVGVVQGACMELGVYRISVVG